jgi:hypothetical protein
MLKIIGLLRRSYEPYRSKYPLTIELRLFVLHAINPESNERLDGIMALMIVP